MSQYKISDVFAVEPSSYGLRGDGKFWNYVYDYYSQNPDLNSLLRDTSLEEIIKGVSDLYKNLFKDELFSDNKFSFVPILSNGSGLSDGIVSPRWWNSNGKVFISENYKNLVEEVCV